MLSWTPMVLKIFLIYITIKLLLFIPLIFLTILANME